MSKRWLVVLAGMFSFVLTAHGQKIVVDELLYSGQLDPQITVPSVHPMITIQDLRNHLPLDQPTGPPDWPDTGFRGFQLQNYNVANFPSSSIQSSEVTVFQGVVQIFVAFNHYEYFVDNGGLQDFLAPYFGLPSGQNKGAQVVEGQASGDWVVDELLGPLPTNGYEPPYNAALWNTGNPNQWRNNCYNYAANKKTGTFAQPGRAGGQEYTMFACPNVLAAAIRDGLVPWVADVACSNYDYKVALVMETPTAANPCDPDTVTCRAHVPQNCCDFHWLRQNPDGTWSQKHGSQLAINTDDGPPPKMPITDPRDAVKNGRLGDYNVFCNFMCVLANPNFVNIR